jgi:D-alanyl-D-alanine carboxypeptidase (penicillin-binding protein 5/6)
MLVQRTQSKSKNQNAPHENES